MNLSKYSIEILSEILIGDTQKNITPHKSGSQLVKIFNTYGFRDIYNNGLPDKLSRKKYTIDRLNKMNNTPNMKKIILTLVDERNYFNTEFNVDVIAKEINNLIKYDNFRLEKINDKYIVSGETLIEETVEVEPYFEDIQGEIIEQIRQAKYMIWVAVAWFTDPVLFEELKKKKQEGLNVQIIVCNDDTTIKYGLNYEEFFETYRIDKFGLYDNNIFHNKFCIIDLKTVIQGSYNWTNKAQYNKEHIEVIKGREIAEKYATRFIELKKQ